MWISQLKNFTCAQNTQTIFFLSVKTFQHLQIIYGVFFPNNLATLKAAILNLYFLSSGVQGNLQMESKWLWENI